MHMALPNPEANSVLTGEILVSVHLLSIQLTWLGLIWAAVLAASFGLCTHLLYQLNASCFP